MSKISLSSSRSASIRAEFKRSIAPSRERPMVRIDRPVSGGLSDRFLQGGGTLENVGQPLVVVHVQHAMHLGPSEIAVDEQHPLSRRYARDAEAHGDGRLAFAGSRR